MKKVTYSGTLLPRSETVFYHNNGRYVINNPTNMQVNWSFEFDLY